METQNMQQPDPSGILQVGMGFWTSKTLLAAVKLKLFTTLGGEKKLTAEQIRQQLHLGTTTRHVLDWLDALTILGFLKREGVFMEAVYSNSLNAETFLDAHKPGYMGGILEMANNRLYAFWGNLEEGLQTGTPQNDMKADVMGEGFSKMYESTERLQEFMNAMSSIQTGNFMALARKFDFSKYKTLTDVGGADGWLSIQLCLHYLQLQCTTFDLQPVAPVAQKKVAQFDLQDRIKVVNGDFLSDEIPAAEIITMGNILHGLKEAEKQKLIDKVFGVLPANGVFIVIENIIDDNRSQNLFGLLMSLNMLIENGDAFDFMPADFDKWTKQAGFKRTEFIPLTGPATAAVAFKD